MANHSVFRLALPAAAALLICACATHAPPGSLNQKYFEREANNYLKFEYDGQVVYCQNSRTAASLVLYKHCVTEEALRKMVENARLARNPVTRGGPPYVATVPGGAGQ